MKVVVAHNRYSSAQPSGENSVVDSDMAQLAEAGVEVVPFIKSSDDIGSLSLVGKAALPISPIYARGAQRELAALLDAERPDVLHLHNPYPFLSPAVIRTAHKRGVPVIQTVHNFRQVCISGLYFRDGHACHDCRGKAFGLPGVKHACYRGSRAQSAIMATSLAANRGTWRRLDRYIALTGNIADHLRDFGIGESQISIKPNSIPDPGEHDERGSGFVFVGRLSAEKGVELLLDAWRRHGDGDLGTLTIIGDGPLKEPVAAAATERGDIDYLGSVPHDQVNRRVRAAAALLMTSVWDEVLPTVVIEALANARPVLATNMGGPPHMIGDAGIVAEPTVDDLAAALPRMRDAAPGLVDAARRRYLTTFSTDVVMKQLLDIYADVASRAKAR
ncbi:MAG TPA: glycosyltransferase [Stackebrandtia sp.]|uniref:glycosyltransferase n=1 Tax=Stackebrandtia sp. TaxID=2023065 RepID=UPI002D40EABD|nr:glycosyltransferase [Stackebrandtia sp.]HZE39781.1 glycosyltransferase [Stackebrandtia sp.]